MVKLYKITLDELKKADYTEVYNLLNANQKKRVEAKKNTADKMRSLAGYYLVFKGARELFGKQNFEIFYNENGKPSCDFCHFSVSHSSDTAVCVFSDRAIGVDIQQIVDIKPRKKYRFFNFAECEYVNERPELMQIRYTEIFTKKESAIKLLGLSLSRMGDIDTLSGKFTFCSKREKSLIITVCKQQVS